MDKNVAMDGQWVVLNETLPLPVSAQFCYKLRGILLLGKVWEAQLTLSQRFVCRKFIGESFRNNTHLGCRIGQESWSRIQLQQRPKLILTRSSETCKKPFKDVLNWGEGTGPLYLHNDLSLDVWLPQRSFLNLGWGSTLGGTQLWPTGSQYI